MTISFQYTPELLQRAHELHYKKFFPLRGKVMLFLGILSIWAGLLLLLLKEKSLWYSIPLIAYGIFAIAFHFYMLKTTGKRAYKRLTDYQKPLSIEILEPSITLNVNQQSYSIEWEKFQKALVNDEMILLYPSDAVFFIFPRKNFEGEAYQEFQRMINEKIAKVY